MVEKLVANASALKDHIIERNFPRGDSPADIRVVPKDKQELPGAGIKVFHLPYAEANGHFNVEALQKEFAVDGATLEAARKAVADARKSYF